MMKGFVIKMSSLINSDINTSGMYRGLLLYDGVDAKVYIPALHNNNLTLFDSTGEINTEQYAKIRKLSSDALFCSKALKSIAIRDPMPCWVTFENGDIKRPVIMGNFGNGIQSAVGVVNVYDIPPTGVVPAGPGTHAYVTHTDNPDVGREVIMSGTGYVDMSSWTFPMKSYHLISIYGRSSHIAANRSGRLHAGVDLYSKTNSTLTSMYNLSFSGNENEPVYACTSGIIKNHNLSFFQNRVVDGVKYEVGQVTIQNDDGSIIRYGEVNLDTTLKLKAGDRIEQGQLFGYVPTNSAGNAMIHFEVYTGTAGDPNVSALTNYTNRQYDNACVRDLMHSNLIYQRRRDLSDSTAVIALPLFRG